MTQPTREKTYTTLRCLCVLSLAAVFYASFSGVATADDATITLDVAYSAGAGSSGSWQLLGRIDSTPMSASGEFGLSAVRALLDDIDFGMGGNAVSLASGIGAIDPIDFGGPNQREPVIQLGTGVIDLIYGQDLSESNGNILVFNVGLSGDTMLASGTFSAGMTPAFGQDDSGPSTLFTQALFLPSGSTPILSGGISADSTFTSVIDNLPVLGDYNLDGTVNAADYTIWRDNENSTTNLAADGNGDLVVDGADYTIWVNNFGQGSVTALAVPEPSTGIMLGLFMSTGIAACRKQRCLQGNA